MRPAGRSSQGSLFLRKGCFRLKRHQSWFVNLNSFETFGPIKPMLKLRMPLLLSSNVCQALVLVKTVAGKVRLGHAFYFRKLKLFLFKLIIGAVTMIAPNNFRLASSQICSYQLIGKERCNKYVLFLNIARLFFFATRLYF